MGGDERGRQAPISRLTLAAVSALTAAAMFIPGLIVAKMHAGNAAASGTLRGQRDKPQPSRCCPLTRSRGLERAANPSLAQQRHISATWGRPIAAVLVTRWTSRPPALYPGSTAGSGGRPD